MNFVGLIEHHARSLLCIAFALAVAGLVAAFILPVGLFPQVSFPRVVVDLFRVAGYDTRTNGNTLVVAINNGLIGSTSA